MPLEPLNAEHAHALLLARTADFGGASWGDAGSREALCARLDGLPLAIELAAARGRLLTPSDLLRRLDAAHDLVRRGDGSRHHSLRAAMETSWTLLTPSAQGTLLAVSVFRGPFGLRDAEAMVDGPPEDALEELVHASLLQLRAGSPPTFRLLEAVRAFARSQDDLKSSHHHRHASWRLSWVAERGPGARAGQAEPLHAVLEAWPDLMGVLDGEASTDTCAAIALALHRVACNHLPVRAWAPRIDALVEALAPGSSHRPELLLARVELASMRGDRAGAARDLAEVAQELPSDHPAHAAREHRLGVLASLAYDRDAAVAHFQQAVALAETAGDASQVAWSLSNLGIVYSQQGDWDRAMAYYQRALDVSQQVGDRRRTLRVLFSIGNATTMGSTQPTAALDAYRSAIRLAVELSDARVQAMARQNSVRSLLVLGRLDEAAKMARTSLVALEDLGLKRPAVNAWITAGNVAVYRGDLASAEESYGEALSRARALGEAHFEANALSSLGTLAHLHRRPQEAAERYREALVFYERLGHPHERAVTTAALAAALADQGNDDQARQVLDEARTLGSGKTIDPTVAVHAHHVLHAAGAAAEPPPRDVLDLHAQLAWAVLDASQ